MLPYTFLSLLMTTSTTSVDIIGVQAVYANLHSYQERDFFFFKQKTAYEMRISDWSSDVCSSDLQASRRAPDAVADARADRGGARARLLCRGAGRFRQAGRRGRGDARRNPDPAGEGARDRHRLRGREPGHPGPWRSEEHTSELQSLMRISYAVFCLKKKN